MRQEPHPFSGFIYRSLGDGRVRVEAPGKGRYGIFEWNGKWLEGDLTHADLHFLCYIGGPDLSPEEDVIWTRLRVNEGEETPPDGYTFGRLPEGMERTVSRYNPAPPQMTGEGPRSGSHVEVEFFLDNDRKPGVTPDVYYRKSPMPGGAQKVSTDRYFDPKFLELERDRIWRRVWQVACRLDDIPEIGDYVVYEVGELSWLVVRVSETEIKAHQNACLHRGRLLRECDGKKATEFRCPYHGWSWKLDGSAKEILCEWDFQEALDDAAHLPGAKVDTWGGWVFINPDPEAMPLAEYLGADMIAQYEKFDHASFWKQAHVTRVVPANWKVAMEAFMEGWHVVATHPQLLLLNWDNSGDRYDVFGHWGRGGHVTIGRSSAHRSLIYDRDQLLAEYRMSADSTREYHRQIIGDEIDRFSDAELNDNAYCDLFPNFHPWSGFARINFRFRPYGNNPDKALMDVILIAPWPKDQPKPPAAKQEMLREDQAWAEAKSIGTLGRIIDQDCANMVSVQAGLKAKFPRHVWLSGYQEGKIRNFHRNYDRLMGLEDAED